MFEAPEDFPKDRSSLLTVSNKYGLTFVGFDRIFKVFRTQDILDADKDEGNSNEVGTEKFHFSMTSVLHSI